MLDDTLKSQLKAYLERLVRPVHIIASLDDSHASQELRDLLTEICLLSDKIDVEEAVSRSERAPSFSLTTPGHDISLRFAGLPMGHEFTSLVLALLQVGGHPPKIEKNIIEQINSLKGDFSFETYFSQSCQNCPELVQALNIMAVLNPRIHHVAIDGAAFPDEIKTRQIMSVPTVFLNGKVFGQGRMALEEILAKLDTNVSARQMEAINAKDTFDVLIIGGGPAGAAAAVYAARKGVRTGIITERFGGQVRDTASIENFISVLHTEGPHLAAALERHVSAYDVDVMQQQTATAMQERNGLIDVFLASGARLSARSVILSTGARYRQLEIPGENEYRNKGVAYCPHCDGPLFKGKDVAVIGGGNSGVEATIDLAGLAQHVTLMEFDNNLRADDVLQRKLRSLKNVSVITSARATEIIGDGRRVTGLKYEDRRNGDYLTLSLEGIFVQIGLIPNTEWLRGTIALSPSGEVITDSGGRTSVPGIFAAGDCTTAPYKQIITALGDGAKASLSAFDYLMRHFPAKE